MNKPLKRDTLKRLVAATSCALVTLLPLHSVGAPIPIRICSIDDRSGAAADAGTQGYQGLQLAVGEVNATGGIGGRKVEVIAYDGKTDPQLTATFASRCAEDDRGLVIIGGNPAAPAAAMIPVATEYSIPYFILAAGTDNLTDLPALFHYRFGAANRQDGLAIAGLMAKQGFKRIAIINNSVPFGTDGARSTTAALEKVKLSVLIQQTYDINSTDLSPQMSNVMNAKPDVLLVFPYPADGARVLRTARQMNLRVPILVARSALSATTRKLAADASDGILIPNTVDMDRPDVKKFMEALVKNFGAQEPTMYPFIGYDAARAALQVMAQPEVLRALDAGNIVEARKAFRDAVERIGHFSSLQGMTGIRYEFSAKRHQGLPDDKLFIFVEVADKGSRLIKANLSGFKPK
jgi:branched-chain amino acid transport system substrate-binding protein